MTPQLPAADGEWKKDSFLSFCSFLVSCILVSLNQFAIYFAYHEEEKSFYKEEKIC